MRLSERNQHDSEITNEWRRARAKEALAVWMKECGTSGDDQTDIQDMITDLLHLARVVGPMRLEDIMRRAQGNHDAEMAEDQES